MANAPDLGDTAALTHVDAVLHEVFSGIAILCELAATVCARAAGEGRKPTTDELASIRPTVLEHLARESPPLAGTGVIAAPGVLADEPRWLEWWRTADGRESPYRLSVDLDPHNVGSYEYPSARWFDVPRRTGRRVVVGPYVDYAGTDEYILTFAGPITTADEFFGVAAADIRATDFELAMLPLLDAAGRQAFLVNTQGRIIASNTPDAIVGSMRRSAQSDGPQVPRGQEWADCDGLPWTLVRP
ncbi:MAG: hypothetical protein GEV10_19240 [Streptosporangiales bacterium]|nr:hypothetical protein [Streptosporangiales bacterium]